MRVASRAHVRSRAPLRLSFCGGGTDILPYAADHGGVALNATIDRFAYATIVGRDGRIVVHSHDLNLKREWDLESPPLYDDPLALAEATVRRLASYGRDDRGGCRISLQTDAPPGSGLGSSSAVVVALANALAEWRGIALEKHASALLAYELEREEIGIPGGLQDQYSATFGGLNLMEFDGKSASVNPVRVADSTLLELEYCLVLCYTGGTRLSANIIYKQIANYRAADPDALDGMRELKALTYAMRDVLVNGRLDDFGALLDDAWTNKKRMAVGITNPLIDEAYAEACACGALGGKMSGAGGGGYMYFYCPGETKHRVSERLQEMGLRVERLRFQLKGVQVWASSTL